MNTIFVDLDDVLSDFDRRLMETGKIDQTIFNRRAKKAIKDEIFWGVVNDCGVKFWSEMNWTSNGKKLWELISPFSPIVISAYKKIGIYAEEGKKIWIRNNLGNVKYILCLREEKQKYANPHSVLIDDKEDNIAEWKSQGGIGILYNDNDFENISSIIKQYLV